ncbi:hypothetical protein [Pseudoxanthomonas japonensis]|nr:hypothetical protein [Pseudoxanthomonas japonensis]
MTYRTACVFAMAACLTANAVMAASPARRETTDQEVDASLAPPPAGWASRTFQPLKLALSATRTRLGSQERLLLNATWCNTSKRSVLVYRDTDWGVSRGILLLRRTATSNYEAVHSVPHRMIPPGVSNRADYYATLEPGACTSLRLEGTAASLSGAAGNYELKLLGIPYATTRQNLPSSAWTMEGGTIESNVLEVDVLP